MVRRLILFGTAALLLGGALLGFMFAEARSDPVVRRATLVLPGLARPVTVALVSDIHLGSAAIPAARLERIVDRVNALRPDMVGLAGDFIAGHEPGSAARIAPGLTHPLGRLRAPLGVVAVLGNHDWYTGADAVRAALGRAGVTVMDNAAVARGPIAIGGVGDVYSGHADLAATLRAARATGRPLLLLTHSPDLAPSLPSDARVLLAGHTHCGQVVLPWWGPVVGDNPRLGGRLYDPRFRCGLIDLRGHAIVVTAGVGGTTPLRLGAPPDIWLLTLKGG